MSLNILTLSSDEDGTPRMKFEEVVFRANDHGMTDMALMSQTEECARFVFFELAKGIEKDQRFVDREQVVVCLSGEMEVTAGEIVHVVRPGDLVRMIPSSDMSHHVFRVLSDEPARFMVVQMT